MDINNHQESLQQILSGWMLELENGMVELVRESREHIPMVTPCHHNLPAPRYMNVNIAIVGGATDSITLWQGSGGAMSVE